MAKQIPKQTPKAAKSNTLTVTNHSDAGPSGPVFRFWLVESDVARAPNWP